MLLCFNRGYVKQMAALPLQVISIGTAINFVVPHCGAAEILLKPSFELTALRTKGILTFHLCTWWHTGWSCILHFSCPRSHVLSLSEMFRAQALMGMGQFALTSQSLLFGVFFILLIKWVFLSSFISLPNESPGWRTCSTWQEIKENFPLVALCRQRTFVLERKAKAESKFFQHCLLGKAYKSCWQKVYSPLQRSQLGDFFLSLRQEIACKFSWITW